jgi:hypothetical protein
MEPVTGLYRTGGDPDDAILTTVGGVVKLSTSLYSLCAGRGAASAALVTGILRPSVG